MSFQGKKAIITGAAKGIGRTIALEYARVGADVAIVDMDEKELETTSELIKNAGGNPLAVKVDLRDPEQIERAVEKIGNTFGRVDILINNAGLSFWKSPYEITVDEWDTVIHSNLRGTFLFSRESAKRMRDSGGGAIVNISSTRAVMSEPDSEAYAASKGGILSLTHAMAVSFGGDKIRVNAISPGWIETGDYSALKESDHLQHPSGRVGKPEDIARACLFLTENENDFITGANIVIDGGMTRKMIYEE